MDESGYQVRMTLWGNMATEWRYNILREIDDDRVDTGSVVGFKGVKVGSYGGRSLSSGFDCVVSVNPDIPEAHRLKVHSSLILLGLV